MKRNKQRAALPNADHESWPARAGHARVLIESPFEDVRDEHAYLLRRAGYDVATCAGAVAGEEGCPLVATGRCPLVDEADVVISTTRLAQGPQVVDRLTARTSPAVVVEGGAPDLERERDVLRDARLLQLPVRKEELLAAVADAAAETDRSQLRHWEDFAAGAVTVHGTYRLSEAEVVAFARFFDPQPFHVDPAAAQESRYGGLIASGVHTFALCCRLITRNETVHAAAIGSPGVENLRWLVPVRPGDELTARSTVVQVGPSAADASRGRVLEEHELLNQRGEVVLSFRSAVYVERYETA